MASRSRRFPSQVLLGLLLVIVGIVLLVDTTGVYDTGFLLDFVPALFVLLGIYAMVRSGFRNLFGPLVVVIVATAWQLTTLDIVETDQFVDFWPLFVVLFGLSLVLGQWRSAPDTRDDAAISGMAIFGGSETRSTTDRFTRADLTAMFGGVELDLRDATVADPPAHVTANALFGGVEISVPREWNVELDVLPVLGGASDDRARREPDHEGVDLVVSGFAAFGGVSVTD